MKNGLLALAAASLALSACGPGDNHGNDGGTNDGGGDGEVVTVTGNITQDTTWTTGNTYRINSTVFVKGARLKIEPGVTVQGAEGAALLITTTGTIDAQGTAQSPIVMTSQKTPGSRAPGDWGGLVLLGNAATNTGTTGNHIEGLPEGDDTRYGGSDNAHDCGTVKYVRIEFAGYEFAAQNELNGLTVGACGAQTEIDFVQVHMGADDGIEFFGGSAPVKHAVISRPDDDALDFDLGWTGKAQFIVIQQEAAVGNMGFEANSNDDNNEATPRTMPELANITMIGSGVVDAVKTQRAMHLREGVAAKMWNFIVTRWVDGIIDVDGASSVAQANAGNLFVKNSIFFKNAGQDTQWVDESTDNDSGFDEGAFFAAQEHNNAFVDPQLGDPTHLTAPNFKPNAGSPALSGAASSLPSGFEAVSFRGAIGDTDWTAGWTSYPEN